jgi:RNA polymerase sigma-70 factor (ECF subfamily)
MEMPPMPNWFTGRQSYAVFMRWVFEAAGTDWRLQPLRANGQPGFAAYRRIADVYRLHTLQVFTISPRGITRNSVFQDDAVFASFELPAELSARRRLRMCGLDDAAGPR